ncbi:site-specific DNA-methyltransferase [Galactobacter valiniphilus]|uniref:Methyltransferase n=1 Tax=Galactobacter valiniphilus TaxID=2676122 RepID=A0A399JHH2_9MICC|nr:site-specific DNA-methyltransferase [Galactobacter valiniphilus]RII41906.1 site-specific DNA-methyltransferase [Galactobacter valiniphilus]
MSIYYRDEHVTLHHGDFREAIGNMTADAIVTDPPYGETSLDWDVWPTGWVESMTAIANSMWCFGSMRMFLDHAADFSGWKLSQDIVWEKHNGSGFATDRFKRVHEHALHWYRGDWAGVRHETPRVAGGSGTKSVRRNPPPTHTGKIGASAYVDDGLRLQRSVLRAQSVRGGIHPTEKPVGILEPLIAYACPPGGLVFDPFAGSGSTLAAAKNLGRRAIGYEIREEQCETTAKRLSQGVLPLAGLA